MYIYHYARYHARNSYPYETLEQAIERAEMDRESGEAWPVMITTESGEVIYDHHTPGREWPEHLRFD